MAQHVHLGAVAGADVDGEVGSHGVAAAASACAAHGTGRDKRHKIALRHTPSGADVNGRVQVRWGKHWICRGNGRCVHLEGDALQQKGCVGGARARIVRGKADLMGGRVESKAVE